MKQDNKKLWTMFLILGLILIVSLIIAAFLEPGEGIINYNTAIIPVNGVITVGESNGFFDDPVVSSTEMIKTIEKIKEDKKVKAVILEINSPGGSPVATDEISEAVKSLKANNITTVAWIREVGASGAYWIASSTDYIVAHRMSITGSIGVYGSYLEWFGLMNRYNVTYKRLVSGEYKDTGTPYRPMSYQEETMIQKKLDKLHEYFINAVAENRKLPVENVKELATGEIFLGIEAKEYGLVDELGSKENALNYIELKINEKPLAKEFSKEKTLFESLMGIMSRNSFYIGKGISSSLIKESTLTITT
ncbi:TPA: signal peptide peptidase SppA [Candidatus Woesearchaeota archaeon]|nr:signal peptide peptidase SppA [Candidatus Woesearchaeota archaeon]HIH31534.1 signal peptide peptidase SppA [Candidatus Woesearchaeota archaeon]HIH54308.1 signal peptide peptidase SppA [Candidatus Woesearchaeota archaeon]HIJ02502.1 signal peptide peptidase SppA [Candidatus Woesearchaeota archaeon]HIJ13452.1 signal peptide peptidase SppA [Candidatus Woesearchaeota archaeon]